MWIKKEHKSVLQQNRFRLNQLLNFLESQPTVKKINRPVRIAAWRLITLVCFLIVTAQIIPIKFLIVICLGLLIMTVCHSLTWIFQFSQRFFSLFFFSSILVLPTIFWSNPSFAERFILRLAINLILIIQYQLNTSIAEFSHALEEIGLPRTMIFALNISLISIQDGAQNLVRLLEAQQIRTLKLTRFSFQKSSHLLGTLVEKIHINSQHHAAGLKIRQINPTMERFRYRYVAVLILTCLSSFLFLGE